MQDHYLQNRILKVAFFNFYYRSIIDNNTSSTNSTPSYLLIYKQIKKCTISHYHTNTTRIPFIRYSSVQRNVILAIVVMSFIKIISILAINVATISCHFDDDKPKMEHTNIVNKGIWLRNKLKIEPVNKLADFIFRPNSLDVDNMLQGNFNAFDDNDVNNSPFLPNYKERSKRSDEGMFL